MVGVQTPWVLRVFEPDSVVTGVAHFVSPAGIRQVHPFSWQTLAVREHVVINEVMANPAGPEPAQEWVELFNDGVQSVSLGQWQLEDAGGQVLLPEVTLAPGTFALIVGETYDAESWVDTAPAPETLLIRVDRVGSSGLSNGGEPLRLRNSLGETVSSVPSISSKEQGWSIARVVPDALDSLYASFAFGQEGGSPGKTNEDLVPID
ncbi:MAG: hypothetical protein CSA75_03340 [Sorangium cellulosum]|nr:MAG: hypothetical protein CSA75_03340 [Sorangium cellulosum]